MKRRALVLAFVVVGLLFTSVLPMRRYFDFRHRIAELHKTEQTLDARAAGLRQQKDLLMSDAEIARIARERLGMVRPGEVPFVIVTPDARAAAAAVDVPPPRTEPGLVSRWWHGVTRALRSAF
jgi:cell division protein FtsB